VDRGVTQQITVQNGNFVTLKSAQILDAQRLMQVWNILDSKREQHLEEFVKDGMLNPSIPLIILRKIQCQMLKTFAEIQVKIKKVFGVMSEILKRAMSIAMFQIAQKTLVANQHILD